MTPRCSELRHTKILLTEAEAKQRKAEIQHLKK